MDKNSSEGNKNKGEIMESFLEVYYKRTIITYFIAFSMGQAFGILILPSII